MICQNMKPSDKKAFSETVILLSKIALQKLSTFNKSAALNNVFTVCAVWGMSFITLLHQCFSFSLCKVLQLSDDQLRVRTGPFSPHLYWRNQNIKYNNKHPSLLLE